MAQALSAEAIASGTGHTWDEWLAYFDSTNAAEKSHQEIVALATDFGAPSWWGQMVTVTYEQHIGRRIPGQRGDGTFSTSTSKTRSGSLDASLTRWTEVVGSPTEFSGVAIQRGPETSASEKWRYWRCALADGSRVQVNISLKEPQKSVISVQHEQLESEELCQHWREFWKSMLQQV